MCLAFIPLVFPLPGSLKYMVWKIFSRLFSHDHLGLKTKLYVKGHKKQIYFWRQLPLVFYIFRNYNYIIRILSNSDYIFRLPTSKKKWRHAILQRNEGGRNEKCKTNQDFSNQIRVICFLPLAQLSFRVSLISRLHIKILFWRSSETDEDWSPMNKLLLPALAQMLRASITLVHPLNLSIH